jgi:hypothetical protein
MLYNFVALFLGALDSEHHSSELIRIPSFVNATVQHATKRPEVFMCNILEISDDPIANQVQRYVDSSHNPYLRKCSNSSLYGGSILEMRLGRDCNQDGPFPFDHYNFFLFVSQIGS